MGPGPTEPLSIMRTLAFALALALPSAAQTPTAPDIQQYSPPQQTIHVKTPGAPLPQAAGLPGGDA